MVGLGRIKGNAKTGRVSVGSQPLMHTLKLESAATMDEFTDIHDIPGTYVFDKEHSRKGYHLNMFCMSLNRENNREQFRNDPEPYLDRFPMTVDQRNAVVNRDWLGMLRLGGNIYYTFKLAIFDRISMQAVGGAMSGISEDEFKKIMLTGGRDEYGAPRGKPGMLESGND